MVRKNYGVNKFETLYFILIDMIWAELKIQFKC